MKEFIICQRFKSAMHRSMLAVLLQEKLCSGKRDSRIKFRKCIPKREKKIMNAFGKIDECLQCKETLSNHEFN